ncbi:MAG: hypothetical protein HOL51_10335 [Gemmatimonadetes bacterium]|nr:hypothetical protein [Gemmatimonadota bacterium]
MEEATYERLGGDEIMVADVRVVVASPPHRARLKME